MLFSWMKASVPKRLLQEARRAEEELGLSGRLQSMVESQLLGDGGDNGGAVIGSEPELEQLVPLLLAPGC